MLSSNFRLLSVQLGSILSPHLFEKYRRRASFMRHGVYAATVAHATATSLAVTPALLIPLN